MTYLQTPSRTPAAARAFQGGRVVKWKGRAASIAPSLALLVIMIGTSADAACLTNGTPNAFTNGADNAFCNGAVTGFDALAGDDAVTIGTFFRNTTVAGNHFFSAGNDYLQIYEFGGYSLTTVGPVTVDMGTGNDRIIYYTYNTPIVFTGTTLLGDGDDRFGTTDDFTTIGDILAGDGNDFIEIGRNSFGNLGSSSGLDAPVVNGNISGGDGSDTIRVTDGSIVNGTVFGGDGGDSVLLRDAGSSITAVSTDAGDDFFTWQSGALGSFDGGTGSDTATIQAVEYDGSQVLDGGDDTGTVDTFIDSLTLQNRVISTNGTNLLNWEQLTVDGGQLTITDNALAVGSDAGQGLFLTGNGNLEALNALALAGNLNISSGSNVIATGGGAGVYSISGALANNGIVTMQDGLVGDVMTVAGNYAGTGLFRVDVNTATDMADIMTIDGIATGATQIDVANLSPATATGNNIAIVTVAGATGNEFTLASGPITAGAFSYDLKYDATTFNLVGTVNPTGAAYEATPLVLAGFNRMSTLEQRVGQRQWAGQSGALAEGQPNTGAWVRFSGDRLDATTTTGSSIASKTWGLQTGADFAVEPGDAGQWVLGVTGQYGKVSSTVTSALGFGTIDAEGFGVGATATWYGNTGTYVDLQGQMNWIDSDISSSAAGVLAAGELSKAYALSAEVGHRFALNETAALVPQAQLTWGRIEGGAFTDSAGNAVDLGSNDRTIGRLGLAYEYAPKTAAGGNPTKAYVIGNILHDFSGDSSVKVSGASLSTGAAEKTWGEIGVGGSYAFDANKTLYGEAAYRTSFGGSSNNNGLSATVGLRIQW